MSKGIKPCFLTSLRRAQISLARGNITEKMKIHTALKRPEIAKTSSQKRVSSEKSLINCHYVHITRTFEKLNNMFKIIQLGPFSLFIFQIKIQNKSVISSHLYKKWNFWNPWKSLISTPFMCLFASMCHLVFLQLMYVLVCKCYHIGKTYI